MRNWIAGLLALLDTAGYGQVKVHPGHRYLQDAAGKPFFWLGDTAWELPQRLTREEAATYLETRRQQGFNVIQIVALPFSSDKSKTRPNRYGDFAFVDNDPTKPAVTPGNDPAKPEAYDYWDHLDYLVNVAAEKGMYVALNAAWGDHVATLISPSGVIFSAENARAYGRFVGSRYGRQWNVIWVIGGDVQPVYETKDHVKHDDTPVWTAMAEGIKSGEGANRHLMTYHPKGARSSSEFLHNISWLDMNAIQSGHGARSDDAKKWVDHDLSLNPPKPTMDMEPCYEDHPINPWDGKWTKQRGYFNDHDVRVRMYRGIFAGGCGVTYGHHQIWQFVDPALFEPINTGDTIIGWRNALFAKAATQARYLKELMLSRPYFGRVPDQSLIVAGQGEEVVKNVIATRDSAGTYAMVYLSESRPVTVDVSRISGKRKRALWFDPRTGTFVPDKQQVEGSIIFSPPATGTNPKLTDWVLVIEDASRR